MEVATKTGILSLHDLKLKQIPPDIFDLNHLKTLDVTGNHILSYPESITNFTQLKILRLDRNNLTSLPYLKDLPRLVDVSAPGNRLADDSTLEFPADLVKLNLARNAFREMPMSVLLLLKLQSLDLSGCQIICIAEFIPGLIGLTELILDENQIEVVPPSIIVLRKLTTLSLKRNLLRATVQGSQEQSIAPELFTSTAVERLHLDGNPLDKAELMQMRGFDTFLERRKKQKQKELQGGVTNFSLCGLD